MVALQSGWIIKRFRSLRESPGASNDDVFVTGNGWRCFCSVTDCDVTWHRNKMKNVQWIFASSVVFTFSSVCAHVRGAPGVLTHGITKKYPWSTQSAIKTNSPIALCSKSVICINCTDLMRWRHHCCTLLCQWNQSTSNRSVTDTSTLPLANGWTVALQFPFFSSVTFGK